MDANNTLIAGRYRLGRALGEGTTGEVFRGTDTQTGEAVAVKRLRAELVAWRPEWVSRLEGEGAALRRLNHPNIVKTLAMPVEQGQHFVVMEYVSGGSLADALRSLAQLPVERAAAIGLDLCDALGRAHDLGILHRAIKPSNILLGADGAARLSDFGLTWLGVRPDLDGAGLTAGAMHYLSPEAIDQRGLDERSDLWSLGVVLYEMLSGRLPFTGDSAGDVSAAVQRQRPPELSHSRQAIPPALENLIRQLLQKHSGDRPASARLVGAELEAIQKELKNGDTLGAALPPQSAPIRVLIVDDHAVVRQGLRMFIELQEDMRVVGEGSNGVEAVQLAGQLRPDIILLDLAMPQMDGVEATARIKVTCPAARVIILTSFGEENKVIPAIRAGAQGYLLKDIRPMELVQAVREAYRGKPQLHPDIAQKLMAIVAGTGATEEKPAAPTPAPAAPQPMNTALGELTERERGVLRLIAEGLTNREIAAQMVISEKTVKTHVSSILSKLGLADRTQAAIWAIKHAGD